MKNYIFFKIYLSSVITVDYLDFHDWNFYFQKPSDQGCPNLLMEGQCPAEVSSLPQHTGLEVSNVPEDPD